MEIDFYIINMQKCLHLARELHLRGFEQLRVFPHVSPSGTAWRCDFESEKYGENVAVSSWMYGKIKDFEKSKITTSIKDLANQFESEFSELMRMSSFRNTEYVKWYKEMLEQLEQDELPYALDDYWHATEYWKTTKGKKIPLPPNSNEKGF